MKRLFLFLFACVAVVGQITNVNIGTTANDKSGDTLRTAFSKVNTNVAWLAGQIGSATNSPNFTTNATVAGMQVATSVNAASDLASISPALTNYVVRVMGRTNSGDGGGGFFRLVSSSGLSTNWGTIFASSSASYFWQRIQEGQVVDLRWYAPIRGQGNGTLNTTKIQQALDYAATLKGAQVFVPDHYYIGQGATAGVGLKVGLNTRIVGSPAQPFTEVSEASSSSSYYGGGYIGGFRTENSANIVLIDFDSTGGYLRQTNQTIWDGTSVSEKRYVSSGLYGILLNGNSGNNQNTALPMVRATSMWNITIENVGFLDASGPTAWFRDCNGIIFRQNNIVNGRGVIIDDCGDYDISSNFHFASKGPNYRFISSWKGTVVNNQTGNSVAGVQGTVSGVSGNVITATAHGGYTGGLVWIYSTGSLPSPLVSTRPYYIIRLTADTFSVASTLANANAGTAVTLTTSGSGTITFNDGPNVSYHLVSPSGGGTSVGATGTKRNAFVGNRSDQTLQGGFVLDGATENTFSGNYIVESKFSGSGTVSAIVLTNAASNNSLDSFVIDNSADVGVLVGDNCNNNIFGDNIVSAASYLSFSATGTSGNRFSVPFYGSTTNISVGSITAGAISGTSISGTSTTIGATGSGTVATITGGTGGASILILVRSGQPTVGLKASAGFMISDDTSSKTLGRFSWQSPNVELTIGNPNATAPSNVVLRGEIGSGTDVAGKELRILAGSGTGSGSVSSAFISAWTPDAGSTGTTAQTMVERVRVDSTTSSTLLPIWINYNGTLKQVQVGAADSGGAGYRLLRITN